MVNAAPAERAATGRAMRAKPAADAPGGMTSLQ